MRDQTKSAARPQGANTQFTNADDLTELIQHNTIENGDGYELRVYPESKWVCTKEYDVDPINDPMNGWQETVSTSRSFLRLFVQIPIF